MNVSFDDFFRRATGQEPFPYQRALAERERFPALVRAPTGAGKTAALVLAWLYRRRFHPDPAVRAATPRRLIYSLPLRTLVEQTSGAVRTWVANLELSEEVAVHDLMGGSVDEGWVRDPTAEAVLVGTMDMLLSRALNRGYGASRYRWPIDFALVNNDALWVLDEVQLMSNGAATSAQLQGLRNEIGTLRPTASVWVSATVEPSWLAGPDFPAPHPSQVHEPTAADWADARLKPRMEAVKILRRWTPIDGNRWWRDLASEILSRHRPGTRTLVVLNTVERAMQLYDELGRRRPEAELVLLHSRFRPGDRRSALERVTAGPGEAGLIAVSTQVVEAGVDLSAATLFTETAPWSSMVQRFGRCNRFGEEATSSIVWVDNPTIGAEPYDPAAVESAREQLVALDGRDVGPRRLGSLGVGSPPEARHVLRRRDLFDLFDTEPDLTGNDVDVSRYIRDDADVDCHVFWRRLDVGVPAPDAPRPHRDELCPVSPAMLRLLLRRAQEQAAFVWDHLDRRWRPLELAAIRPGLVVMLNASAGGYDRQRGFDPSSKAPVEPVEVADLGHSGSPEAFDVEEAAEADGGWVSLLDHATAAAARARELARALLPPDEAWLAAAVETAARWHDVGKAHRIFQEMLLRALAEDEREVRQGTLWAKSPSGAGRYERPHFRHELASALAFLAARGNRYSPDDVGVDGAGPDGNIARVRDLVAYLVAAHHGKVRLAIRSLPGERRPDVLAGGEVPPYARGVWSGDVLPGFDIGEGPVPTVTLDLSIMAVGESADGEPSWLQRTLDLLSALGPFKLAYLEALVRLADWHASGIGSPGLTGPEAGDGHV